MKTGRPRQVRRTKSKLKRTRRSPKLRAAARMRAFTRRRKGR